VISHKHQCIFIHIPKAAGTSIEKKLGLFEKPSRDSQDHRTLAEIQPLSLHDAKRPLSYETTHAFYRKIIGQKEGRIFPTQVQYDSYYRFSFIRNPWSRVFSWYRNVFADPIHQKTYGVDQNCTFDTFVHEHLEQWALHPQLYWLRDRQGQIPYDFIGKFENLYADAATAFKSLGLDPDLPKLNMGTGESYQTYYNQTTKTIVAQKYAEEIEMFGYYFQESVSKPLVLSRRLPIRKRPEVMLPKPPPEKPRDIK
jgi:hypothetical protein